MKKYYPHHHFKVDKKKGRRINWTANTLVNFFHSRSIEVMRYDAMSTNSIYLKLDYGLLYSIRLSDHAGKQYLNYRFNATDGYCGPRKVKSKWDWQREFYSLDNSELNDMCRSILLLKAKKMIELGPYEYQVQMDRSKRRNCHNKGFWSSAQDLG